MDEALKEIWKAISELIKDVCSPDVTNYFKFLSGGTATDKNGATVDVQNVILAGINGIFSNLCVFGLCLSIVFCIIELNKKFAFEGNDLTLKSIFVPFLKLGISVVVLANGGTLIGKFLEYHDWLIDNMSSWWDNSTEFNDAMAGELADMGLLAAIVFAVVILLLFIVAQICGFIWRYKGLTYKIELIFRAAIAPVALADIYSGQNSTAVRYLKGFLATAFYAAMVCVVPQVGITLGMSMIQGSGTVGTGALDNVGYVLQLLVLPIAELGMMGTLKSLAKEAVGS